MKNTIVFWATNENEQEILAVLRLREHDNKVDFWTFDKAVLAEAFIEKMFKDWDVLTDADFALANTHEERKMSDGNLLPDEIRTKETDLVSRAEKEWFVKVLSLKLMQQLTLEIDQLVLQVGEMEKNDPEAWDITKSYWDKVNRHYQERDLTRDQINTCFSKLKELRKSESESFESHANAVVESMLAKIEEIVAQVANSHRLNDLFNNLRQLQTESQGLKITNKLAAKVRNAFNIAFEAIRSERKTSDNSRSQARLKGLEEVIKRMEKSIEQDQESLQYQQARKTETNRSLESQLLEAKIAMIEARIESKLEKLADMQKTFKQLKNQSEAASNNQKSRGEKEKAKPTKAQKVTRTRSTKPAATTAEPNETETTENQTPKEETETENSGIVIVLNDEHPTAAFPALTEVPPTVEETNNNDLVPSSSLPELADSAVNQNEEGSNNEDTAKDDIAKDPDLEPVG